MLPARKENRYPLNKKRLICLAERETRVIITKKKNVAVPEEISNTLQKPELIREPGRSLMKEISCNQIRRFHSKRTPCRNETDGSAFKR